MSDDFIKRAKEVGLSKRKTAFAEISAGDRRLGDRAAGTRNGRNWLQDLVQSAVANGWCLKPVCTTCGAIDFRTELVRLSALSCGAFIEGARGQYRKPRLWELPESEREKCIEEVVAVLRLLSSLFWATHCPDDAHHPLHVILMDLNVATKLFDRPPSLDERLAGSAAGDELQAMRRHCAECQCGRDPQV